MGVAAISLNATVVGPVAAGNLRFYPAGTTQPLVSNLNYGEGDTLGNGAVVAVAPNASASDFVAYSTATTDLVIDVTGYFAP